MLPTLLTLHNWFLQKLYHNCIVLNLLLILLILKILLYWRSKKRKIGSKKRNYKTWPICNNLSSEIVFETFQHLTSALILNKQRRHIVFIKSIYIWIRFFVLQTKCQSFKSYLLEINSEAEQNWLMDKGILHFFLNLNLSTQYIVNTK